MNRGRLCVKGDAIPEFVRAEERLKYPMKRTTNGFKRISWDEALGLAAEKLGEIRSKYGPLSLARCIGAPVSYQCRDGFAQFMGEYGSPNMTGAGNLCMVPRVTAFIAVTGETRAEPDYDSTNLVLYWGANPVASERFGSYSAYDGMRRILSSLKKRGVKIIAIDPFRTGTVKQADEWVQIRPGSDAALGLAMIHVIIAENLYDRSFVETYTTGFEALKEHVKEFSPKWAESYTGIQEKRIAELARTYATARPAAIYEGNGLDMYANGVEAVRTVAMLISLTGNLDVPGGNVFMPFAPQSRLPTKPLPMEKSLWREKFPVYREVPFTALKEAVLGGEESRPRALIVHHSNPVLVQANERRTRKAMERMDFIIASEIFPTATSEMADLVLPIASDFETFGYRAYSSVHGGFLALARPIAPPVGESRPVFEVEYELAERMGLHQDYPFRDTMGWLQFMIRPSGVDFERISEEQIVYATEPVQYRKFIGSGFNTPSGKVEFYSKRFKDSGYSPMPCLGEPAGEPMARASLAEKGFPLLGTSRRPSSFVHTKFRNLNALSKLYPGPLAWMNPVDASLRGLSGGDRAQVTSPHGEITLKVKITENTYPGLVWIDFGWGNPTDGQANINVLTDDAHFDPISGGTPNRLFPCEVRKAV